ncbi:CCA tRNA nucleotidyltransferase [Neobacillus sp. SM06]|uniref:CCA tRNA nucleotidyltransferase n=1 Tax=Neobacillus sp. SM06 TaxID=3422492 RepID=UPI003D29F2AE
MKIFIPRFWIKVKPMLEPFVSAVPLLEKLENAGFEAYFVGGSVRDFLLGKPINDVDIATSATPLEMKRIFPKTVDVGIEHGTILVLANGIGYEITTFRAEAEYVDYRKPKQVIFIRSLIKDLKRRDFTMNAIAMDRHGKLIDPFNGQIAIKQKRIETVGKAKERFQEDALRMMRAVRFVSQLSFSVEAKTLQAVAEHGYLLEKIAVERKQAEFAKLLTGSSRRESVKVLLETNLYRFLPGLQQQRAVFEKLLHFRCETLNLNEMWALLIHLAEYNTAKETDDFLRKWKLPVKQIKEINSILAFLKIRLKHDWTSYDLYCAGRNKIESTEKLFQVISGVQDDAVLTQILARYLQLPIKERSQLNVTGQNLIDWLKKPGGPWVRKLIEQIELKIIENELKNEKQAIKEWLLKCNQN